jgi:hypothetical protein
MSLSSAKPNPTTYNIEKKMLNLKKPNEKKDSHKETNEKRLSFLENRIRDAERQLQNVRESIVLPISHD